MGWPGGGQERTIMKKHTHTQNHDDAQKHPTSISLFNDILSDAELHLTLKNLQQNNWFNKTYTVMSQTSKSFIQKKIKQNIFFNSF